MLPLILLSLACSEYEVITDLREQPIQQHFTVEGVRTDILFYSDTSYSMERELVRLAANVDTFIERLEEASDDWRITTVTGPTGCSTSGILSPDDPDFQELFTAGVLEAPGQDDVDEWGLFNTMMAVINSAPGQCNDGFVRGDATLHVIILSDEDDNSPGWEAGGDYWRQFIDPIVFYKGEASQVRISAVVGPANGSCATADPGNGYIEAVEATGGELLNICDDWIDEMDLLADASISQDFFALQYPPLDDTLSVEVNGEIREAGWAYEEDAQGVRFSEDIPGAWDEVSLFYRAIVEVEVDPNEVGQ